MPFHFLTYLQPTHFFQLPRKNGGFVFPVPEALPPEVRAQLVENPSFESKLAVRYDLSWQAIQKGYIGEARTFHSFEKLPLADEYRFVRSYFNPIWAVYVLLLRLFAFKNPINEVRAFFRSKNSKRSILEKSPLVYADFDTFESPLLASKPLVTVVIPTLNRYDYLKKVLQDLEKQDYGNFEVLAIDQSDAYDFAFYTGWNLNLKVKYQREKALWRARNEAIEAAKGEYVLLFDDDSSVATDWISSHLKALDFFKADISSGVSISTVGAEVPANYGYFRLSDQLDTGNVLIKKEVFRSIGLFDRQFEKQRMGDGEFGARAYLNGFLNVSNPFAKRLHFKAPSGGLRQMGSWDAFRPKKLLAPRPVPSVLYFFRKYFGRKRSMLALLKTVPPSVVPYRFKKNKKMLAVGVLISLFLFPFVLLQIAVSWRSATKKLQQGALIGKLN